MAEQVQALMERMVTPLRDLRDRGIFTEVSFTLFTFGVCRNDFVFLIRWRGFPAFETVSAACVNIMPAMYILTIADCLVVSVDLSNIQLFLMWFYCAAWYCCCY